MNVFPSCMSVHYMHAVLKEARRGHEKPGTGVIECFEPSRGC